MRLTRFAQSRLIAPMAALLLVAGCDYFGGAEEEAAGDASGEVLDASVTDEMIATQDLKSQPPALAVQPGEGGAGGEGADSADSAVVDGDAAAVVEEPAVEAEPAADE